MLSASSSPDWRQTKAELTAAFFDLGREDRRIGVFALAQLPETLLRKIIAQHNAKIERIAGAVPHKRYKLRHGLKQLRIPTYEQFQQRLAVKEERDRIEAQHRKARDFEVYRSWVLDEPPIGTHFREVFFRPQFPAFAPEKERRRHSLIVSRSGGGKSELLKLLALKTKTRQARQKEGGQLRHDRSLVLIDPHGDLAEQLARQRCFAADFEVHPNDPDLIYLEPLLGANQGRFSTLNPLDIAGRHYSDLQREKLAEQLVKVFKSLVTRNDYSLTLNMETLLVPCLNVLLRRPGSTFYDLLRFFEEDRNGDLIQLGRASPNPGHRFFFESSFTDRRFDPTKGALSTKVQSLLNSRAFAMFLSQPRSTFDLEAALESGKTIVLNCAVGKAGAQTAEALGRFVVGMLLAIAFNRAEAGQSRKRTPIWLFIDEMQRFVSDELRIILAEARKYGLHLALASQVVGQGMSPELTRVVLGNTAVQMLGTAGADSQAAMAREMGVRTAFFSDLRVGEFAVKCGATPPIRVRIDPDYLGRRTQMTESEWQALRAHQLGRYYRPVQEDTPTGGRDTTRGVSGEEEARALQELSEEIAATASMPAISAQASEETLETSEEIPAFDTANPFADLDED